MGCGRAPLEAKEACRLTTTAKLYSTPLRSSLISPTTRSLYAQLPRTVFPTNKPKTRALTVVEGVGDRKMGTQIITAHEDLCLFSPIWEQGELSFFNI